MWMLVVWLGLHGCGPLGEDPYTTTSVERCTNGVDDDGNGLADCADPACGGQCTELCTNFSDDDGDGLADCSDPDCAAECPEQCGNATDDDGDGAVDCADSDCDGSCAEQCDDGRDNDLDGEADCDDSDCDGSCVEICEDGRDNDGDGNEDCFDDDCLALCDIDGDGFVDLLRGGTDCNDGNDAVHPAAAESCNGIDDDCDTLVDDGDETLDPDSATPWYGDLDGDGFGAELLPPSCGAPPQSTEVPGDCNDGDIGVHPSAIEICNDNVDDDCSGLSDDDDPGLDSGSATNWFFDLDHDGFGLTFAGRACDPLVGWVAEDGDCNDANADIHPDEPEICNGIDDDCDFLADDDDDSLDLDSTTTWYVDLDGDGYGVAFLTQACDAPPDGAPAAADCNDANDDVNPGALEICNAKVDDDCDALSDDADPSLSEISATWWYDDDDLDTFGDPLDADLACVAPAGFVLNDDDCNDTSAAISPVDREVCNSGVDDDCDGLHDDADPSLDPTTELTWYRDVDVDGFGNDFVVAVQCAAPLGGVADTTDCDDTDAAINPDAAEVCNLGVDDDCDGDADMLDPTLDRSTLVDSHNDLDRDGFGNPVGALALCELQLGDVANGDDCNDSDEEVNPDATEVCNGFDDNCDGDADDDDPLVDLSDGLPWFRDADDDGYGDPAFPGTSCEPPALTAPNDDDCNDASDKVNPGEPEVCNTHDDDCDGLVDDDDASLVGPVVWYADLDGDGVGDAAAEALACIPPIDFVGVSGDCDDTDPALADLTWWGTDEDGDSFGVDSFEFCGDPGAPNVPLPDGTLDCDDLDAGIHPDAVDVCEDSLDQDCDGFDLGCAPVLAASYPSTRSFNDSLGTTSMGVAYDGTHLWTVSGGSDLGTRLARYTTAGAFVSSYAPGIDFRRIFTKGDGDATLWAQEYDEPKLMTEGAVVGTFVLAAITLPGVPSTQTGVVYDELRSEFVGHYNGTIYRWNDAGVALPDITLVGYGTMFGEAVSPQFERVVVKDGYYVTYSGGRISVWSDVGIRVDTAVLTAAGTTADSYWSFSYADGTFWVIDSGGGDYQGFEVEF